MLYIILHFLFIHLKKTHISPPVWPRPNYRGSNVNIGENSYIERLLLTVQDFLETLILILVMCRSLSRARAP
jgi:hypothetical protein